MMENAQVMELDTALRPWVEAGNETQSTNLLEDLLNEQIEPLIREIVGYQFRVFFDALGRPSQAGESEDVCSEVRLQLLTRLRELQANPTAQGIRNLRSYVAVTAYRACYEYLRRKYPKRHSLKHKLRFLLSQHPDFAIWPRGRGNWLTGLAGWPQQNLAVATRSQANVTTLLNDPLSFATAHKLTVKLNAAGLSQLLKTVFAHLRQPLELDELVSLVAAFSGLKDLAGQTEAEPVDTTTWLEQLPDPSPDLSDTLAQRSYLARLWQEVRQMSPRHCAALLLNLRDERGGSATELLVFTGVASFTQLAEALALSEPELAELWQRMPLDDLTIAERLGLNRQQVINLRRSARERLWRRMHDLK
jgi:DNA-directed RNA polymerase specialized sigma24 family protein